MRLIILDRDGVVNQDTVNYVKHPDEWHPISTSIAAIAQLKKAGFTVAVATNQSGLARGYYDEAMLAAIHHKMQQTLMAVGGSIDYIAYCPHLPEADCACRKPKPGLLYQIAKHFGCSLENVPFVGDRTKDLQAAIAAGARPIGVRSGLEPQALDEFAALGGDVFDDLAQAVTALKFVP